MLQQSSELAHNPNSISRNSANGKELPAMPTFKLVRRPRRKAGSSRGKRAREAAAVTVAASAVPDAVASDAAAAAPAVPDPAVSSYAAALPAASTLMRADAGGGGTISA